jgi:hypothetical protein
MRDGKSRPSASPVLGICAAKPSLSRPFGLADAEANNLNAHARNAILVLLARHLPDLPRILADRPVG